MTTNEIKRFVLKNGDILLIPLTEGKAAIGQLIYWNIEPKPLLNPLLKIVNGIYDIRTLDLSTVDLTNELFPPIATGVRAAIRSGMWKKLEICQLDQCPTRLLFRLFTVMMERQEIGGLLMVMAHGRLVLNFLMNIKIANLRLFLIHRMSLNESSLAKLPSRMET